MLNFKKITLLASLAIFSTSPVLANDDEVSIIGGVSYNFKNEDFKIGGKPFNPEFTTIDWSVIAAYKSAYLKLNYDQSIKDETIIDTSLNAGGSPSNQAMTFSREDMALTLGYSVLDNLSLFIGYLRGEMNAIGAGEIRFQLAPILGDPPIIDFVTIDVNLKETGSFAGFSYSHYIGKAGSLSFSVAYAQLDGVVSLVTNKMSLNTGLLTTENIVAEGDANGVSYSLTWSDRFSERMQYKVSFKSTRYEFDAPAVGSDSFDFDDVFNVISIGLSKYF